MNRLMILIFLLSCIIIFYFSNYIFLYCKNRDSDIYKPIFSISNFIAIPPFVKSDQIEVKLDHIDYVYLLIVIILKIFITVKYILYFSIWMFYISIFVVILTITLIIFCTQIFICNYIEENQ